MKPVELIALAGAAGAAAWFVYKRLASRPVPTAPVRYGTNIWAAEDLARDVEAVDRLFRQ